MDCLIAVHAIRENIPLLHADADFDVLAHHTGLLLDTEGLRTTHP
jgi:predicted nucleic acid-binding protein